MMASPPHDLYVANTDAIERTIASVCRRHQLFGADAEDFAGIVRLHLIEDNYAVLRRFEGRSSLTSFLIVVITRQFQDWRNARWGKWRPSAEAKRLGETAVRLETLTVRDGLSLDEAHEVLRTHYQVFESRASLEAMATRFPVRHKRMFVDDSAVEMMAAPAADAEMLALTTEGATAARHASTALTDALRALPPQDHLILRMRFKDNCQIADIAKALHLEAKPLYRRIEKLLATLRATLEQAGLTADVVATALDGHGFDHAHMTLTENRPQVRPFEQTAHSPALTGGHRE